MVEKIDRVSALKEEYTSFKSEPQESDDQFKSKIEERRLSDGTTVYDQLNKVEAERSYTIKKRERTPLFNALKSLTEEVRLPKEKQKEMVKSMLAWLSLAGLSTYQAYQGDRFRLKGSVLTMNLRNVPQEITIDFSRPLAESREAFVIMESRKNLTALKEEIGLTPENSRLDENKEAKLEAFERVLDSGSIVRVRESLHQDHGMDARKKYWDKEVQPNLGKLYGLLTTENKNIGKERFKLRGKLINESTKAEEKAGIQKQLDTLEERSSKLETMIQKLEELGIKKGKITSSYNGEEELNMVFIEFYRYGMLKGEFPDVIEGIVKKEEEKAEDENPVVMPRRLGPDAP
ncbi:MAG: hypothetical protein UW70_C0050G0006 [Candidatus Peregrinibacteria bacterium GW2011_GWA2_44_7]|nr:MAG: hypothetical protein UW70_C0050G0006 [Candidatus Peregrinibacteria bacterium GW2011_GWA2_44_7]